MMYRKLEISILACGVYEVDEFEDIVRKSLSGGRKRGIHVYSSKEAAFLSLAPIRGWYI